MENTVFVTSKNLIQQGVALEKLIKILEVCFKDKKSHLLMVFLVKKEEWLYNKIRLKS